MPRTGAPKKITERDIRKIKRFSLENPNKSSRQISIECAISRKISHQYIRTILLKNDIRSYIAKKKPFLTKNMAQRRLAFAKKYRHHPLDFWHRIIYSDESYFSINLSAVMNRVRRFRSSNPFASSLISPTVKYPPKVMIWGCINYKGPGEIKICQETMNRARYLDTLEKKLIPSANKFNIVSPIHLDDSAPCHRGKEVEEWHTNHGFGKILWPGNSPDLNPIENVWGLMKAKLRTRIIRDKRKLIESILEIWREDSLKDYIVKIIDSMPQRLEEVIKNKGFQTKY